MSRAGLIKGAGAYLLWGLSALYWPLLEPAGTLEILVHRIVWSLAVLLVLLTITRRWNRFAQWRRPTWWVVGLLAIAAALTTLNWGLFIYAVTSGHVVEASLGYFIAPLVMVALGVRVLRERPTILQWTAVGIAAAGVMVLATAYGRPPWIALGLATTFALYGLTKKHAAAARVGAVEGMAVETGLMFVPAVTVITWMQATGTAEFGHVSAGHTVLMAGAGLVMLMPMLLFSSAGARVPLSVLGMLQYVEPIVQFVLGVVLFAEAMPPARWFAFMIVWCAVAVLMFDLVRGIRTSAALVPRRG